MAAVAIAGWASSHELGGVELVALVVVAGGELVAAAAIAAGLLVSPLGLAARSSRWRGDRGLCLAARAW